MQMYGMSGEPLGLIGRPESPTEKLPAWKQDILSKPSASVRKGIAWVSPWTLGTKHHVQVSGMTN